MERGAVVNATGRFSSCSWMRDGRTPVTLFRPVMIQDVTPYRVSVPVGPRSRGRLPPPPMVSGSIRPARRPQ